MKLLIKILKNFRKLFKSEVTSQELNIREGLEYLKETSESANKTWELFQYFRSRHLQKFVSQSQQGRQAD
jgi:thioredoxin-related protein